MATQKTAKRPKITTIEGLAIAMQEGFSVMNERFDRMDKRFDRLESQLKDLENRVSALEMKVSGIYRQLSEDKMHRLNVKLLIDRVAKLEEKVFGK